MGEKLLVIAVYSPPLPEVDYDACKNENFSSEVWPSFEMVALWFSLLWKNNTTC